MSSIAHVKHLHLERPWQLEQDTDIATAGSSFRERLAYDERLLEQVAAGEKPPTIRIWRNRQCLVATRKEARQAGFKEACAALGQEDWPVLVRRTGGSCIPQSPGVLNFTLAYPYPRNRAWSAEDSYRLLCAPLQQLLESYALRPCTGEVPGSFCDGKFNLQVADRKLVGTSQRWKGYPAGSACTILAHACLLVDIDLGSATAKINQLYQRCGYTQQFDPLACTTLRECMVGPRHPFSPIFVAQVIERLSNIIEDSFPL